MEQELRTQEAAPMASLRSSGDPKDRGRAGRRHRSVLVVAVETVFRWLGYGCDHDGLDCVAPAEGAGWAPRLALVCAAALLVDAFANGLSLDGWPYAEGLFWVCFGVIVVPSTLRLAWPRISRAERIWLLNILSVSLYLTRILATPTVFYGHDEYVHWSTTIDIVERHHLFTMNSLLPASPFYPGMEIVTSALVQMTGLSVHLWAVLLVCVLRILCTTLVFLIFERIAGSSWLGAIASVVYMANSNFFTFLTAFSYETFALDFLLAAIFVALLMTRATSIERRRLTYVSVPILLAVAVSHHLTSWIGALILSSVALLAFLRGDRTTARAIAVVAGAAVLSISLWNSVSGADEVANAYVGNTLARSLSAFFSFLSGTSAGRALFQSADGVSQPLAYQVVAILSVVLISAGLVVGFFRALGLPRGGASPAPARRKDVRLGMRDNAFAIALTLSSFLFPLSVVLRLTSGGWELGNRMSAYVFLGVGLVVAVGAAKALITPQASRMRAAVLGLLLAVTLSGGVIAERPPDLLATPYRPAADGTSIEPMGIATTQWTRDWLGEGHRFAADRVNTLLLATYGVQRTLTCGLDGEEPGQVLFHESFSSDDQYITGVTRANFLLADLRLQHGRPLLGEYFSACENPALHKSPPLGVDLQKFDNIPGVGRIYDNGYEVVYDIRNLIEPEPLNRTRAHGGGTERATSAQRQCRAWAYCALNVDAEAVGRVGRAQTANGGAAPGYVAARANMSVDKRLGVGRTFSRDGSVNYDAVFPGPPFRRDRAPPNGAQAPWLYSVAAEEPWIYDGAASGRRVEGRTVLNYDAGVLRHVPK